MVQGSGFRVQGSGCRVQGAGFRVQGAGFRVQGSGFGVERIPGHHSRFTRECNKEEIDNDDDDDGYRVSLADVVGVARARLDQLVVLDLGTAT